MTKRERYKFIGKLAIALFSKDIKITLTSLNQILKDENADCGSNRGLAKVVKTSYDYFKEDSPKTSSAIAYTFTNKYGKPAWK
ncbi:MAG: hypothetical protein DRG78_08650 [Epsilonproteobacteria bacterium]|nr:MAG: hypothetical protein DRG78_08650 [Campylobacterota bacterium]